MCDEKRATLIPGLDFFVDSEVEDLFKTIEAKYESCSYRGTISCPMGFSPSAKPKRFKAIELKTKTWAVKPLHVDRLKSSYFEDQSLFPMGTIQFDNALLMEGIEHEWVSHKSE